MDTVDLTPKGCETPKGIDRCNKAVGYCEDAMARATVFLQDNEDILAAVLLEDYPDLVAEARALVAAKRAADKDLVLAVSGRSA